MAVVGTVYKDMKMKPNILDEYTKVGCGPVTSLIQLDKEADVLLTSHLPLHVAADYLQNSGVARTGVLIDSLGAPSSQRQMTPLYWKMRVHACC